MRAPRAPSVGAGQALVERARSTNPNIIVAFMRHQYNPGVDNICKITLNALYVENNTHELINILFIVTSSKVI